MITSEKLKHRVDFLIKDNIPENDYGEKTGDWTVFKTVWASKEPLIGNQFFAALTTDTKVEVKFNTRYTSGITSEMRIKHGEEIYEITSPPIDVNARKKELICYCKKVDE
jgi:SPP1 family predicted phage head-tail adaptor